MRSMLLFVLLISGAALNAQTPLPLSDYMQRATFGNSPYPFADTAGRKWFLSTNRGFSTSFNFFNGTSATVVSVPLGLQLNRRLNNNLYAFAGLSVAPAYINFGHSFLSYDGNKPYQNNGFFKSNSLGVYSRAELGLMYINDAKTFSVSGSIGVERSSYPFFPYQQMNTARPNPAVRQNK